MNASVANAFHDWISIGFSFDCDFIVSLEIADKNNTSYIAKLTFKDFQNLEFIYWTFDKSLTERIERSNTEFMRKSSIDRWLQNSGVVNGFTEIQLIGENDFSDSHVVVFRFQYSYLEVMINGITYNTESQLAGYLEDLDL